MLSVLPFPQFSGKCKLSEKEELTKSASLHVPLTNSFSLQMPTLVSLSSLLLRHLAINLLLSLSQGVVTICLSLLLNCELIEAKPHLTRKSIILDSPVPGIQ